MVHNIFTNWSETMDDHQIQAFVMQECRRIWDVAQTRFKVRDIPLITFYRTSRNAGMAWGGFKVGFNLTVFAQFSEWEITEIVAHELAHSVCSLTGIGKGHNAGWKMVCRMLGGNGQRCFKGAGIEFKMSRQRKQYEHRATCGTVIMLSDVMHNKVMGGDFRTLRRTNGTLNRQTFTGKIA